ncbi:unnamed protein product [Thelazia callipaeda]|uniref:Piwi domain-containing protein n=1 Tax=Thelazia callipaeda TaxID=103827 RepID=A0A0N5CN49_THECL|nr:unnamed protein product [Thelazia callipaeda]
MLMSPVTPSKEKNIPSFRPRGRGKRQPDLNASSGLIKVAASVGGENMESLSNKTDKKLVSEMVLQQSSACGASGVVTTLDSHSEHSTSSSDNTALTKKCDSNSTPPSVSDQASSVSKGVTTFRDSVHSSAVDSVHSSAVDSVHNSAVESIHSSEVVSVHSSAVDSVHSSAVGPVHSSSVYDDSRSQTSYTDTTDSDVPEMGQEIFFSNQTIRNFGPSPCLMAPKLPPAVQREKVFVKTNVFPLEIESRVVYRYDVRMYASRVDTSQERTRDLCRGDRDEYVSAFKFIRFHLKSGNVSTEPVCMLSCGITLRHRKCMLLMRRALELYRVLNENAAYLYDLSSTLFTNEPINKDLPPRLKLSLEQLTPELRDIIGACDVTIEISPCTENAHTFNVSDYRSSVSNDLARQDRSFRQFFEILTNNNALQKGTHYAFGCGKLFLVNGKKFNLNDQPLNEGRTLISGVEKGIRFIERSDGNIIPALIIDLKKAAFFDAIPLEEMVQKVLRSDNAPVPVLDRDRFSYFVRRFNDMIRVHIYMKLSVGKNVPHIPMLQYYEQQGYHIRSDWPAVRLETRVGTSYFPIEVLRVAPFQRVPLCKQTPLQMKSAIKECAVLPYERFRDIKRNLQALNLDVTTRYNPFMAAFGVRINATSLTVEAHRRVAPRVQYSNAVVNIDTRNANWRMTAKGYLVSAYLRCWYIFYDDVRDGDMVMTFAKILIRECYRKGIQMVNPVIRNVPFECLEKVFKQIRGTYPKERVFIMYIDSRDDTHDDLKLCEALYRIITQHIHVLRAREAPKKPATLENIINKLNCKNFGQCYGIVPESFATNKWISTGKTLIIGYDVCHPEPQSKHERRMKIAPSQPSVLGISFNGAVCPETFIGDYSYQEPRKEQVTSSILEERMQWILGLFQANRNGMLPELIIITRDGVSEGQFKMVMEDEVEALRQGMRNYGKKVGIKNYSPSIVCIIACKRHNKRFAIDNGGKFRCRTLENCLPLTVIDRDITRPDTTEFFMQSHKVIKGTGKLPAYSIPLNEAHLNMDEVQALMMALCFTHQIVNQAISIPEPIYQADEWAKRGRNNFKAMLRRARGKTCLPTLANKTIDWSRITQSLCYMNSALELTRANA